MECAPWRYLCRSTESAGADLALVSFGAVITAAQVLVECYTCVTSCVSDDSALYCVPKEECVFDGNKRVLQHDQGLAWSRI